MRERGRSALSRGDLDGAVEALCLAAAQTHVTEQDYASVLTPLAKALGRRGDARGALTVLAYLSASNAEPAFARAGELLVAVPPVDRARVHAAQGRMADVAREMENASLPAGAAIFRAASAKSGAAALGMKAPYAFYYT